MPLPSLLVHPAPTLIHLDFGFSPITCQTICVGGRLVLVSFALVIVVSVSFCFRGGHNARPDGDRSNRDQGTDGQTPRASAPHGGGTAQRNEVKAEASRVERPDGGG